MMQASTPTTGQAPHPAGTAFTQMRVTPSEPLPSAELLKGAKSVLIEHNGSLYRLQSTKLGKLILTK
jgi:hemin uptake protein HemP